MKGIVKWFNIERNFGLIVDKDGNEALVYCNQNKRKGLCILRRNGIVDFEIKTKDDGKKQVVNVVPIVMPEEVSSALAKKGLRLRKTNRKSRNFYHPWIVVDEFNVVLTNKNGMSLDEVAKYAGIDINKTQ